jgi:hypothetical protein
LEYTCQFCHCHHFLTTLQFRLHKAQNNMEKVLRIRFFPFILLLMLLTVWSPALSAQEETETPAVETPVAAEETATEVAPTDLPTSEAPTPTAETTVEIIPTEAPTFEATPETTAIVPEVTGTALPPTAPAGDLSPEPALRLVVRDLFETEALTQWALPGGWTRIPVTDGFALQIKSTEAGTSSAATLSTGIYSDLAVMGYFTLEQQNSAIQLTARDSAAGAYTAQLDGSGLVTLSRGGSIIATATVTIPVGTPFTLRLSAINGDLRVTVNEGEVIAIVDNAPLPPGQVKVGALFSTADAGNILFDNFFLWSPAVEAETPPTSAPTPIEDTLNAIAIPDLTAPALNGVVTTLRPTFSWRAVSGANLYHLRVATNFSCSTSVFDIETATASYKLTSDLPQGEYWFCVEARDTANNWTGFGEKRRFVVNVSLTPANGSNIVVAAPGTTANIKFTWTAIPGASYAITVATDSSFSVLILDNQPVTGTTFTLANQPFGIYYWRVTVNNGDLPMSLARSVTITPPLPLAPVIQTPGSVANAGFTNDTTPFLDWTVPGNWVSPPPGQSITYELELATDKNFTALVAVRITGVGNDNYEWTATTLAGSSGQVYYWRARAVTNLAIAGAWSKVFSFTLDTVRPEAPLSLTTPADTTALSSARPAFTWKTGTGANRYRIEISQDNSDFDPLSIPSAIVTTPRYTSTISLPQGIYFWRVWSIDAAGNESLIPTETRSFGVNYSTVPAANAIITSAGAQVNFTWAKVLGLTSANTLVVQVDNNSNFNSPERISPALPYTAIQYSTSMAGSAPNTNPLPIGIYYWRVLVNGHPTWPTTLARSFTISPAAPAAPSLTSPAARTNDTTPVFNWNVVTSPTGATVTGYELQLSISNNFTTLVGGSAVNISGGGTTAYEWSAATLPDSPGQLYYARIRAVTNLNVYSRWSTVRSFTLDTEAPAAPILTMPAANATITAQKPTFRWGAVSGAVSYEIRFGTTADLSAISPIPVNTTTYVATNNLLLTTYYWQARAIDAAGNVGNWTTPPASFQIVSPPGAAPTAWFYTDNTPDLQWTPLFWAVVYEVQVSRNSAFTDIVWQSNTIAASNAPSVTIGTALADGSYYWRVRGKMPADAGGAWGAFSAFGSFSVDAP